MTAIEQASVSLLRRIVAEVSGHVRPYYDRSYLPAHLVHEARSIIDEYDRDVSIDSGEHP